MKKTLLSVIVLLVLVGGGYYIFQNQSRVPDIADPVTVRLSWVHQAQFAGMYTAFDKGFYADAGLDVTLLPLDQNKDQIQELARGEVDVSVMEAHQLLTGADRGSDVVAVAAIYQVNPHSLAARADSGIDGPEDFDGKTFGLAGGTGEGTSLLQLFVQQFGGLENVEYRELGFDTVDDFVNKRADVIDVYVIDQPYLAEAQGVPLTIISLDAYGLSTYGDIIAVERSFIEERPDVLERFVKATLRGLEYALENPDEAIDISLAWAEGNYKNRNYQEHIFLESIPLIQGTISKVGRMDLVPWSTLYESMRGIGALERELDVRNLYTNQFIQ